MLDVFNAVCPCLLPLAMAFLRLATQMFLMPSLITMTLAATRMYRSLAHFTSLGDPYDIVSLHSSWHLLWTMSL
jgi:hypothetical protein